MAIKHNFNRYNTVAYFVRYRDFIMVKTWTNQNSEIIMSLRVFDLTVFGKCIIPHLDISGGLKIHGTLFSII